MVNLRTTFLGVEVLASNQGVGSAARLRTTFLGAEVLASNQAVGSLTRTRSTFFGVEVLASNHAVGGAARVRTTFLGIEVLASALSPPMRTTFFGLEVLAPRPPIQESQGATPTAQKFFVHNWADEFVLETSFETDISYTTVKGAEERFALLGKPNRVARPVWNIDAASGFREMIWDMHRRSTQRTFLPLQCDAAIVTSDVSAFDTLIPCDPSLRRFFVGATVLLAEWTNGQPGAFEFLTIAAVTDAGIETVESISVPVSEGQGVVMPIMLTELELSLTTSLLTDSLSEASLPFREVFGPQTLRVSATGTPSGLATYQGLPVLRVQHNWESEPREGVERKGKRYAQGRGAVVTPHAERGSYIQSYSILSRTRSEAWEVIQLLESRYGRAGAFWAMGHASMFDVLSSGSNSIQVAIGENFEVLEDFVNSIGFEMNDRSVLVREISSVVDNTTSWGITFVDDLPAGFSVSDVAKCSWAARVRNQSDSITERWYTLEVCEIDFSVIELLDERSIETPDLFSRTVQVLAPSKQLRLSSPVSTVSTS